MTLFLRPNHIPYPNPKSNTETDDDPLGQFHVTMDMVQKNKTSFSAHFVFG